MRTTKPALTEPVAPSSQPVGSMVWGRARSLLDGEKEVPIQYEVSHCGLNKNGLPVSLEHSLFFNDYRSCKNWIKKNPPLEVKGRVLSLNIQNRSFLLEVPVRNGTDYVQGWCADTTQARRLAASIHFGTLVTVRVVPSVRVPHLYNLLQFVPCKGCDQSGQSFHMVMDGPRSGQRHICSLCEDPNHHYDP